MKKLKLFDYIIVLAVIAASAAFLFAFKSNEKGKQVSVSYPGADLVYSLDTDREVTIESNGHTLVLVINDGEAYIKESDCRDQYCVKAGKISKVGEKAVCAPARLVVKITDGGGSGEEDADAIAG